jgi:hypothetical protein
MISFCSWCDPSLASMSSPASDRYPIIYGYPDRRERRNVRVATRVAEVSAPAVASEPSRAELRYKLVQSTSHDAHRSHNIHLGR